MSLKYVRTVQIVLLVLPKWMLPAETWETVEVGVRGNHRASVLDGHRCVLGVGDELGGGAGAPAEIFEDLEVVGAGMDDVRIAPVDELADETEDLVMGGRLAKNPRVGHDSDNTRQRE